MSSTHPRPGADDGVAVRPVPSSPSLRPMRPVFVATSDDDGARSGVWRWTLSGAVVAVVSRALVPDLWVAVVLAVGALGAGLSWLVPHLRSRPPR